MMHRLKQLERPNNFSSSRTTPPWMIGLIIVVGVALWLRVWGINFGLPYDLTYDEPHEILRALKLGAGEYYWGNGGKGGLYYLLFIEYGFLYVTWWAMGWVNSVHDFALLLSQDPSAAYLTGRLTIALLGTLTCLIIFLIGKRLYDWRVGLGAAFIGATAYQHAVHSHIINVDIGMVLALWASILAYLKYEEKQIFRWLIGAGVLAGIAVAHKRPGAIVLIPLFLAISFPLEKWRDPSRVLKELAILLSVTLATLTLVAPEWTTSIGEFYQKPDRPLGNDGPADWTVYLKILLQDWNILLSFSALLGVGLGLLHRNRWDIIWGILISVFLIVMTVADPHNLRPEYYLLPIMPALWLLSSQAIFAMAGSRQWLVAPGIACIVALSLFALVRQNYEWTKPDTRVVAKDWIEANIPSGMKILMDGMEYRFVPSPPLKPSMSTRARQVERVGENQLSRGVSRQRLALYAQATAETQRPTYDLYSTVWGRKIQDPAYYVQECFDYIVTSSYITRRYTRKINHERFQQSAWFYEQLHTDPRFQKVYSVEPVPWERGGPIITVYKVIPSCNTTSHRSGPLSTSKLPIQPE